jgi:phage shock protein A
VKRKKLQKKVGLLEKKVTELTTNNEDLKLQLLKTKDNLHITQQTKDDIQRKMTTANANKIS